MFYLIWLAGDEFSYNQSKRLHMLQIICNSRKASLKTKRWVYISASLSSYIPRGGEHNNTAVPSLYMVRTRRVLVDSEWMCHSGNNHKQLHKWLILHVTFPHFHSNNTDIVRSFLPLFRCLICYVGEQHSSVLDRSNFKLEPNWFNRGRSAAVSFSHPCNKT